MNNMELIKGLKGMDLLIEVVRILRSEDGCPWDREQTLESLKQYYLEETYELIDAVDSGEAELHQEELGDVLMHILLQAQIQSEDDKFNIEDVAEGVSQKLIRRHPHVFGQTMVDGTGEVLKNWEAIKAEEKKEERDSILDGVPRCFPALRKAQKIQIRAARVGFDWDNDGEVIDKIEEELEETKAALKDNDLVEAEKEIGDLLFAVVNIARFHGIDSEHALEGTISRFQDRFRHIEQSLKENGLNMQDRSLAELEELWQEAKRRLEDK